MAAQEWQQARTPHRAAERTASTRSAPDSDKDSGFSDVASECLSSVEQTDSEEAPQTSRWRAAQNPPGCPQSPPPPLLILKNLLVDQGSGPDPHPHTHSWTVHPSFQLLPTSSPILLFPPSVTPSKPQPSRKKSTKYIPILNSYPKIAPYPSQQPARGNKRKAKSWHQNQTKRYPQVPSCSSEKVSAIAGEINVPEEGLLDEVLTCPAPGSTPLQTENTKRLGTGGSEVRAVPCSDTSHKAELSVLPRQKNKNRRFQNTLDILNHSGLLSIAIKMKELARLNQATQRQLEKLQEQVRLYAKAANTNYPEDWKKLQVLLTEGTGPMKELRM